MSETNIKEVVKEKYGKAVVQALKGSQSSCCGSGNANAGALEEKEYRSKLTGAGFENVDVEPTRIYRIDDARTFLSGEGIDVDKLAPYIDGKFMSAFIRARKPSACCASDCCS